MTSSICSEISSLSRAVATPEKKDFNTLGADELTSLITDEIESTYITLSSPPSFCTGFIMFSSFSISSSTA